MRVRQLKLAPLAEPFLFNETSVRSQADGQADAAAQREAFFGELTPLHVSLTISCLESPAPAVDVRLRVGVLNVQRRALKSRRVFLFLSHSPPGIQPAGQEWDRRAQAHSVRG